MSLLELVAHLGRAFGRELRTFLEAEAASHPEVKEAAESLEAIAKEIYIRVDARLKSIQRNPKLAPIAAAVAERKEEATPPALAAELVQLSEHPPVTAAA